MPLSKPPAREAWRWSLLLCSRNGETSPTKVPKGHRTARTYQDKGYHIQKAEARRIAISVEFHLATVDEPAVTRE